MKSDRASFRGVPFFVDTAEHTTGRRGVTHEYPFRDMPYREDLGRKARTFRVEGYVCGATYRAQRDRLLEALEAAGPGELEHPTYGALQVAVDGVNVREAVAEGGMARFSVEFVRTEARPVQPTAVPDAQGQLRASAARARAAVAAEFTARYSPGVHRASLADTLRRAVRTADAALVKVTAVVQTVALRRRQLDSLLARADALVNAPSSVLESLAELLAYFGLGGLQGLLGLYRFESGSRPPATTANRRVERDNFDVLTSVTRRLVAVRAAEVVLDETFRSHPEAVAARDAVTALLDEQSESAEDDVYPALQQLRADVVKAVPGAGSDLPRLLAYTPAVTTPSLVLTHRLYGTIAPEADVLARNGIRHPGLVPGGRPLEVLSRG